MKNLILLLLGVVGFSWATLAQTTLYGTLHNNQDGTPIYNAKIDLVQKRKTVKNTLSDKQGKYLFTDLTQGLYTLKISHADFKDIVVEKIIIANDTTLRFALKMEKLHTTNPDVDVDIDIEIVDDCYEVEELADFNMNSRAIDKAGLKGGNLILTPNDIMQGNYNTESYDPIKENTFQNSRSNPLSTFSIDVDRAAYANMRRYINTNKMPYKDAIRVEEMINYFDYDYQQPKGEHPFSISLEGGDCPWNSTHQIVHIGLQGEKIASEVIPTTNLVFLVDVSGSMSSANKLTLLKKSFDILIDKMRPQDRVAIVVYAGAAGVVLPSTSDKEKIREALNKLQAGGSTAGGAGIKLAYKIAEDNFIKGGNNRIILATDGDFNVGVSNNGALVRMIEQKRKSGVFLSILGFGMGNYKDARMEQISNAGNGNYFYIDNILEAKKVFGNELWGTLYTIAKDVKIQIEFNPNFVEAYRLIGYENRLLENKDFKDDTKDAGEIGAGHSVTAIYEIIPAGSNSKWAPEDSLKYQRVEIGSNSSEVCTVKFRYKKPDGDTSILLQKVLTKNAMQKKTSNNMEWALAVAEFGMLLRDSEFKGNASYESVLQKARLAKGKDEFGYRAEFIQLVEKAQLLDK